MALKIKASKIGSEDFKVFIEKNKQFLNNEQEFVNELINPWIDRFKTSSNSSRESNKKQKELIDLAKFIYCYNKDIKIENALCESPDFAVSLNQEFIGMELADMVIIESERQREGILKRLFNQITKELKKYGDTYNGLYAFDFINNISLDRVNLEAIKYDIIRLIQGKTPSNNFVTYFDKIKHNDIYIYNAQASMVGPLYRCQVEELIRKKEKKIVNYYSKGYDKNWLLLIAGGVTPSGNYSFIEESAINKAYNTDFDKVFFMNFFKSEFFELETASDSRN